MDARGGGGHLLALDQGGSPLNSSHQGFILFVLCVSSEVSFLTTMCIVQDIFELSMILATYSQCNLASLDVFEDDIPQVQNKYEAETFLA